MYHIFTKNMITFPSSYGKYLTLMLKYKLAMIKKTNNCSILRKRLLAWGGIGMNNIENKEKTRAYIIQAVKNATDRELDLILAFIKGLRAG